MSNGFNNITGRAIRSIGDVNGDGLTDFNAVLVSGDRIGEDFGGFCGTAYFEVWNVNILSTAPPAPMVSISIDGGANQECAATGGSEVSFSATVGLPGGTTLASVTWLLDDAEVTTGEDVTLFVGLGTHSIKAIVETTDGRQGMDEAQVSVADTTPPTLDVAFIDSRSGAPITHTDRPGVKRVTAHFQASDVCDPNPVTEGTIGSAIANGDRLRIKPMKNIVVLPTSEIELSATATDASGNTATGKTTLTITE